MLYYFGYRVALNININNPGPTPTEVWDLIMKDLRSFISSDTIY